MKLPLMKNCRVDYKYVVGSNWSVLIEFTTDKVLYTQCGTRTLREIYSDFKFSAINQLPIDNFDYIVLPPITKLDGLKYYY